MQNRKLLIQKELKVPRYGKTYLRGEVIDIKCNAVGVPIDVFWYRRLRDAAHDGCVRFLDEEQAPEPSKKSSSKASSKKLKQDANNDND